MKHNTSIESTERPEDLGPGTDKDIEAKIDRMLDPALPDEDMQPDADSTSEETPTAPKIVKKSKKIAITHHTDDADDPAERPDATKAVAAAPDKPDTAPPLPADLQKAIEETNAKLAAKVSSPAKKPQSAKAKPDVPDEDIAESLGVAAVTETVEPPADLDVSHADQTADEFDDAATDKAVDDIIADESDQLLAAQDNQQASLTDEVAKKPHRNPFGFLKSRLFRWSLIIIILAALAAATILPTSRYYALNTAGVRSSASLHIIDQSTQQPLKGVKVQLADKSGTTDADGMVRFEQLRLGPTNLSIQKRAFAAVNETVTIGWGSNPLGNRNITPAGSQYTFTVTDFMSGKPIYKAAANAGESDAQSNEQGQIKLTLESSDQTTTTVSISAQGYRTESINLELATKQSIAVRMVPSRKVVFVSKRSGTFDVYKVDLDGKNESLVLKGTGSERDDLALVPHPNEELAALVSTRDNKRNKDGYLLSTLTLINLRDNTTKTIASSEQIQIANWLGEVEPRLVYIQVAAGASAADPNRQRLMSYDYKSSDNRQLATSNYFNDVLTASNKIYYAPSTVYQPQGAGAGLFSVKSDGASKGTVLPVEVWNLFRTSYDKLIISVPGSWYEYKLDGSAAAVKLDGQPANVTSRVYVDSPDQKNSLWTEVRDGKGVLLQYNLADKSDKVLRTQSGLKNPIRWLNDRIVLYRIQTDQETADYALSLDGGEPIKVRDVTATGGIDKWYYYN